MGEFEEFAEALFGQLSVEINEEKIVIEEDLPYCQGGDVILRLELVRPKLSTKKKRPAILFFHGGGFVSGSQKGKTPLVMTTKNI